MKITVFGGSAPKPGEPAYQEALQLGRLIGQEGHTVLTGGYIGTMEAVSRGCAEAGGQVIGVTCEEIESWRSLGPNQWVMEERRFKTVRERLFELIDACDAALALPGGVGTLTEIAMMWNQIQTQAIPARPLIVIGSGWKKMFESMFNDLSGYMPTPQRQIISFFPEVNSAFGSINQQIPTD